MFYLSNIYSCHILFRWIFRESKIFLDSYTKQHEEIVICIYYKNIHLITFSFVRENMHRFNSYKVYTVKTE